jgi:uncharacterized Ntn-hydrolase superfamily protein
VPLRQRRGVAFLWEVEFMVVRLRLAWAVLGCVVLFDVRPGAAVERPVHTFSIVARDPKTGDLGVAVQSHWFSVGSVVPWAEAGVGAVATQSFVKASYGPLGLALLRSGKSAQQALNELLALDPRADVRQVAIVDAKGGVAVHTGAHCIAKAGHHPGAGYSAQANLMLRETVWDAMGHAYESAEGDLAARLLAALDAAQREGGDIRGRQSAAILIVRGTSTGHVWEDRLVDLRVEDSTDPVAELTRLVKLHRAYDHMNAGDLAVEHKDVDGAAREYGMAEALVPDSAEMLFWHAIAMAGAGRIDAARPLMARAYGADSNWRILLGRLPASGLLDEKWVVPLAAVPPEPSPTSKP